MEMEGLAKKDKGLVKLVTRVAMIMNTRIYSDLNHALERLTVYTPYNPSSSRRESQQFSINQIVRPKEFSVGTSQMQNLSMVYGGDGPSVNYDLDGDMSMLDSQRLSMILRQSTLDRLDDSSTPQSEVSGKRFTYTTYANQLRADYNKK